MDAIDCKLKIIFYNNILKDIKINELLSSIEHCLTIQETLDSVNQYKNSGYQVFVVCQQPDAHLLDPPILNGSIDAIYILDEHAVNITNNNRRIIAANERDLQIFIIVGAANYIRSVAMDALIGEVNGQITAHLYAACRLLDLVRNLQNQGH